MNFNMAPVNDPNPEEYMKKQGWSFGTTLGEGSYARVKKCENASKEKYACKIICKKKAPKDFVTKFLPRELDILRRLNHENVVKTSNVFEVGTKVFIMMEMADHGDLLDYIKKNGGRPNDEAKRFTLDILHGIEYIHSINVVHRDLKCENLLMFKTESKFKVKLADFGFARSTLDGDGRNILSDTYCGSAAYAAPEILKGTKYYPKRYDMWSIGVILFIIVCGSMPFDDSDIRKMLKTQLKNDVHFPSRTKDKINEDCTKLVRQLLEVDVDRRITVENALKSKWFK